MGGRFGDKHRHSQPTWQTEPVARLGSARSTPRGGKRTRLAIGGLSPSGQSAKPSYQLHCWTKEISPAWGKGGAIQITPRRFKPALEIREQELGASRFEASKSSLTASNGLACPLLSLTPAVDAIGSSICPATSKRREGRALLALC